MTVVGTNLFDVQAVDLDTATVYSTGGNDYTQLSQFASLPASSFTPDGTSGTMGTVVLPAEPAATVVYVDVVTPGGGGLVQQFTGDDPPALQANLPKCHDHCHTDQAAEDRKVDRQYEVSGHVWSPSSCQE